MLITVDIENNVQSTITTLQSHFTVKQIRTGARYTDYMPLTSRIAPPNPSWPQQYRHEATRLEPVFGTALVAIHHVGSTAVPGLYAKPEIDLLAVVENTTKVDAWSSELAAMLYRRGGDLSEGHLFYKRDSHGVRTHKLHVCVAGHPKISEMIGFRDFLRVDRVMRETYQELKLELERQNTAGIAQYLKSKEPFIRSVLSALD